MRYYKQKRGFDCGPVVLLNAMKWAGFQRSAKEYLPMLTERVGYLIKETDRESPGTEPLDFQAGLICTPELEVKAMYHVPNLRDLDRELKMGRAIILRYFHNRGGHYTLIVGKTKHYYTLVNDGGDSTVIRRSRESMKKFLKGHRIYPGEHRFAVAWSVEPNVPE